MREATRIAVRTAAPPRPGLAPAAASAPATTAPSPLEATLRVLDDRWKVLLVWQLFWGARPFGELMRRLPGITKKSLRHRLAEMERQGLVTRTVRADGHPSYALTLLGETLKPIVGGMYEWGLRFAASSITPARPATAASGPPESPRAIVLRLLAEGPVKPRSL